MYNLTSGHYSIRVYCLDCNELLQESAKLSKKKLCSTWNEIILGAPMVPCKKCEHKAPNFHIKVVLYNDITKQEILPENFPGLKLSKKKAAESVKKFNYV